MRLNTLCWSEEEEGERGEEKGCARRAVVGMRSPLTTRPLPLSPLSPRPHPPLPPPPPAPCPPLPSLLLLLLSLCPLPPLHRAKKKRRRKPPHNPHSPPLPPLHPCKLWRTNDREYVCVRGGVEGGAQRVRLTLCVHLLLRMCLACSVGICYRGSCARCRQCFAAQSSRSLQAPISDGRRRRVCEEEEGGGARLSLTASGCVCGAQARV